LGRYADAVVGRVAGLVAVVVGLSFLVLTAPHVNPWDLRCLAADGAWDVRVRCPGSGVGLPTWAVAAVALAGVLAPALAVRDVRAALAAALGRGRTLGAVTAAAAFLLFTLVPTGKSVEILLGLALGSAGVVLTAAGAVALCPTPVAALTGLASRVARGVAGAPRWVFLAAVFTFVFVACDVGNLLLFGRIPHVVDAMGQLFHARMFADGRVAAPPPEPLEAFDLTHMICRETWYSQYPPGHTLLLSLGLSLGAPWIVNALFGALAVVLLYWIGVEVYDENAGRTAAVLGALSPFLLLMSSSFMNHATTLFFFLAFCLFFARMARLGGIANALLAGGALGYAVAIRPMTAVAAAVPMAVFAVVRLVRSARGARAGGVRSWLVTCGVALAAFCVPVAGLLAFNQATNGDPWTSGFEALNGANALPGFGNSGWWDEPHTAARGVVWTWQNFAGLHQYLFGWPVPALVVAILGFAWFRPRAWDWLLAGAVVALALAHATYWYHDWTLGPRFLYCAAGPLVLLSARGLNALPGLLRSPRVAGVRRRLASFGALALMVSFGYAWTVTVPVLARYYSRHYFDANASIVHAVLDLDLQEAVVFVPPFHFPGFFAWNEPLLDGDVVVARDLGDAENRKVMARYAGRRFYKVHCLESYEVHPYMGPQTPNDGLYALAPGRPLTIEALTSQMGRFADCMTQERKTGEFGGQWKNHDAMEVLPRRIGADVGFALSATAAELRTASLVLTRAPYYGIVAVSLNGTELREVDLYSTVLDTVDVTLSDLRFEKGINFLVVRITGKNEASQGFGFGLDYVRILAAP
jgi:hypothetical protein